MADFNYAKGRIEESIEFITKEMEEFEQDYESKIWKEYKQDNKLQKLIDRTVENIAPGRPEKFAAHLRVS